RQVFENGCQAEWDCDECHHQRIQQDAKLKVDYAFAFAVHKLRLATRCRPDYDRKHKISKRKYILCQCAQMCGGSQSALRRTDSLHRSFHSLIISNANIYLKEGILFYIVLKIKKVLTLVI